MSALIKGSTLFGKVRAALVLLLVVRGFPLASAQTNDSLHASANSTVSAIAIQADGKILVGGDFSTLGGQPRNRLGRLNQDGTLDPVFNPAPSNSVAAILVQPDGKIVAAGAVKCFVLQSDGKILIGGAFTTLAGQARSYLGRLNSDGSLDTGFHPVVSG